MLRAGDIVGGRFELERLAGSGGMGDVFRAHDRITGYVVAIKILHPARASASGRFFREARVLAGLHHPAIVRYITHGESPQPFLAMEWLDGEDLASRLSRSALSQRQAVLLAHRVAQALAVAHDRGVVHRDVKPSNIFLPGGSIEQAKVLDFGVARVMDSTRAVTATGEVIGTLRYMAPEQAGGARELDARADVFALGCVLFECLTGRPAFQGESVMAVLANMLLERAPRVRRYAPDVPVALDELVCRMMAREARDRPEQGAAVVAALRAFLDGDASAPGGEVRGAPAAPGAISNAERRLTALVLAARPSMRGTDLAQTLSAEAALRQRREVTATVQAFGGRIDALPDEVLAVVFHATTTAGDLAAQAARCALALQQVLPWHALVVATGQGQARGSGAGVPHGEALDRALAMLRATTWDGAEEGPAARLRVDPLTAGLLDGRFAVAALGPADRELRGERDEPEFARSIAGRAPPFVGRERELGTLAALFDDCAGEPRASAVLVTGPPGVGKSRLCQEFARPLAARGEAQVCAAWGLPHAGGARFTLLVQVVRKLAGLREEDPPEAQREALVAFVSRSLPAPEARRAADALGPLAGTSFGGEEPGAQTPRAWQDFVTAACARGPVVLVLDDLQWADADSVEYLDAALRVRDRALMVLAAARPGLSERFPRLWAERGLHEVRLQELSRRAAERLLAAVLPSPLDARVASRALERAAGNPRALDELLRALAEGRAVDALPGPVLADAQAALERLEAPARRFLRAASLFGETFWLSAAASALALEPEALATLADALCERELLVARPPGRYPEEREYAFRRDVTQRAAYEALTERDRRAGHRLAADWLESRGERDAMVLAEHMAGSDEPGRAVVWYLWAAEQAFESRDLSLVGARAERGVACGASGPVLGELRLLQAEALAWRGAPPASAAAAAREALALLLDGSAAWCRAAAELVLALCRAGDVEQARIAAAALARLDPEEPLGPGHCAALARAAAELAGTGEDDLAAALQARLEQPSPGADAEDRATQARFVSWARVARGLWGLEGARFYADAEELAEQFASAGAARFAAAVRADLARAYEQAGDRDAAERVAQRALEESEAIGLAPCVARARAVLQSTQARRRTRGTEVGDGEGDVEQRPHDGGGPRGGGGGPDQAAR